ALLARIATAAGTLDLAGTHPEVRDTPACRARQVRAIVDALPSHGPAVFAGDLNTSTFPRGTFLRTARGTARLLGDADRLRADLVDPTAHEPLFLELRRSGL